MSKFDQTQPPCCMNITIPCIVIDDDQFAIDIIKDYINEMPALHVAQTYSDPLLALQELPPTPVPTLVFLDVDMQRYSGLKLAETLKGSQYHIIFTTGHMQYAFDAWGLQASQFLLKPIELSGFIEKVSHVIAHLPTTASDQVFVSDELFVRAGERGNLTKILKSEIYYLQGARNYLEIFFESHHLKIYMTLKQMEAELASDNRFFRVHHSYTVNTSFIDHIKGNTIELGIHKVNMAGEYREKLLSHLKPRILVSERLKASEQISGL